MILDKNTAKKTAELLLQINAIKFNTENPFTWASGWEAPIYCDNRLILSFPNIRNYIKEQLANQIENIFGKPHVVAGVATGAIGIGVLAAEELGLPFVYVRPKPKEHGGKNQVEGFLDKGQTVVVVEDLVSTGNSSLQALDALRKAGAQVKGMVAVFSYDMDVALENFKAADVALYSLSDYNFLMEQAIEKGYLTESEQEVLKNWKANPANWKP